MSIALDEFEDFFEDRGVSYPEALVEFNARLKDCLRTGVTLSEKELLGVRQYLPVGDGHGWTDTVVYEFQKDDWSKFDNILGNILRIFGKT